MLAPHLHTQPLWCTWWGEQIRSSKIVIKGTLGAHLYDYQVYFISSRSYHSSFRSDTKYHGQLRYMHGYIKYFDSCVSSCYHKQMQYETCHLTSGHEGWTSGCVSLFINGPRSSIPTVKQYHGLLWDLSIIYTSEYSFGKAINHDIERIKEGS